MASPVATTAGMAYSRATGRRERRGAAVGDDGGRSGEQRRPCRCGRLATRMSPSRNAAKSCGPCTMRTGPVARLMPGADRRPGVGRGLARRVRSRRRSAASGARVSTVRRGSAGAATAAALTTVPASDPVSPASRWVVSSRVQKNTSSASSTAPAVTRCSPRRRTQARSTGQARVRSRACSSRMTA